ncbi:MAG: peptidase M64 [Acidobacteria bacterium]|nr:MAG: peptidase M64 [Acidobacteriota bacterium]MCE7960250.1 peptidase M64 [Acidobacteria bacterium ACB2]
MRRAPLLLLAPLLLAVLLGAGAPPPPAATPLDAVSTGRTMRLDLFHTGGKGLDVYAVDRAVDDGEWAGSATRLLDDTELGAFRFEVRDASSGRAIYSRGYSSLFGEWVTTAEARTAHRTFPESLRFPWPKSPVTVVVSGRDARNRWVEAWRTDVDPASPEANAAPPPVTARARTLFESGPPREKVDLLLLGEGYTEAELPKLDADAARLVDVLFRHEPFRSRRSDFNVRTLALPSRESGIFRPSSRLFRRTPLSVQYGIFGSERYALATDNRALREAASAAPYDVLAVLVNEKRYGGGGIFNSQAAVTVDTGFADYVFVHELGHAFAGLADEYYTADVAYETGRKDLPEPWEPNVTALRDPASLKWRELVSEGTPIPTPWDKEPFEAASRAVEAERKRRLAAGASPEEVDALFREQQAAQTKALSSTRFSGKVGAFEGAAYEATGLYRPAADCIMFTRDPVGFCPVCRRAVERVIDLYARP